MAPLVRRFAWSLILFAGLASAATAAPPPKDQPKDVDLVICLDVSGSMNGLIESARTKLWDVVNELARMKPTPNLRVGLYTYGRADLAGKQYISRDVDLTSDRRGLHEAERPPAGRPPRIRHPGDEASLD